MHLGYNFKKFDYFLIQTLIKSFENNKNQKNYLEKNILYKMDIDYLNEFFSTLHQDSKKEVLKTLNLEHIEKHIKDDGYEFDLLKTIHYKEVALPEALFLIPRDSHTAQLLNDFLPKENISKNNHLAFLQEYFDSNKIQKGKKMSLTDLQDTHKTIMCNSLLMEKFVIELQNNPLAYLKISQEQIGGCFSQFIPTVIDERVNFNLKMNYQNIIQKTFSKFLSPEISIIDEKHLENTSFKIKEEYSINVDNLMGISIFKDKKHSPMRELIYGSFIHPGKKFTINKKDLTVTYFIDNNIYFDNPPEDEKKLFETIEKAIQNYVKDRIKEHCLYQATNDNFEPGEYVNHFTNEFRKMFESNFYANLTLETDEQYSNALNNQISIIQNNLYNTGALNPDTRREFSKNKEILNRIIDTESFNKFILNVFSQENMPSINQEIMDSFLTNNQVFLAVKKVAHKLNPATIKSIFRYIDENTDENSTPENSYLLQDFLYFKTLTMSAIQHKEILEDKQFMNLVCKYSQKIKGFTNEDLLLFVKEIHPGAIDAFTNNNLFDTKDLEPTSSQIYSMVINCRDIKEWDYMNFLKDSDRAMNNPLPFIEEALKQTNQILCDIASFETETPSFKIKTPKIRQNKLDDEKLTVEDNAKTYYSLMKPLIIPLGRVYKKDVFEQLEKHMPEISNFVYKSIQKTDLLKVKNMDTQPFCLYADALITHDLLQTKINGAINNINQDENNSIETPYKI